MSARDAAAIIVLLACALAMLLVLRLYRKWTGAEAEWIRKLAHVGTGGLSLAFPWIFANHTPVFVVCGLSLVLLLAMRSVPAVRSWFTGVLDGVARESWGELCFPVSVAVLFELSHGNKLLYAVPLLVLTLADTVAALTGAEYGKHSYRGFDTRKSIEGSVAFFCVAFFSVHVALLLFSDAGRIETLLISLNIALIVMLLEAIAWRGLDNVFIPIGVFILLRLYLTMPLGQLWNRFRVASALVILVTAAGRRTTLQGSALLASALVLYISWALGGWRWLVAPALLFLLYTFFFRGRITSADRTHNVYAVLSVASTGFVWMFLFLIWQQPRLLFPYMLAYSAHLAIIAWNLLFSRFLPGGSMMLACVVLSWLVMFAPYVAIERASRLSLVQAGLGLLVSAIAFGAFYGLEPRKEGTYPGSAARWLRQGAVVFVATLATRAL